MIKAISRQILEVSDTGNTYFEKAWLMINPQYMNAGDGQLEEEAEGYLCALDAPGAVKARGSTLRRVFRFLASAACGGLATALFFRAGSLY